MTGPKTAAESLWRRDPAVWRGAQVEIELDGARLPAFEGESLAMALAAAGVLTLRRSPGLDQPRGVFCLMGVCQECVVLVEGEAVAACMQPVKAGMRVTLKRLPPATDSAAA